MVQHATSFKVRFYWQNGKCGSHRSSAHIPNCKIILPCQPKPFTPDVFLIYTDQCSVADWLFLHFEFKVHTQLSNKLLTRDVLCRAVSSGWGWIGSQIDGLRLKKCMDCEFLRYTEQIPRFQKYGRLWISWEFWPGFWTLHVRKFALWILNKFWINLVGLRQYVGRIITKNKQWHETS